MSEAGYQVAHISEIPEPEFEKEAGDPDWHPIRIHFGISSFGTNAYVGREPGQGIVTEHNETDESGTKHEELYFVASGHATFTIEGEEIDAPAGTFVYVPDPDAMRSAVGRDADTAILCFGGTPGQAFTVSPWEQKYDPAAAR
jgi:mannose-6-phosphate isomerase-like protein (cupin superfamily)